MIAKRADILPFWEESKAKLNQYGPNSVVYYQKTPDSAGYAYRATSATYVETLQPPDINYENWSIDKTYAVPWKADGKYEVGSRVFYFNGSRSYVYTPTVRYFGGNQPPNEELDEDEIRTWEIEMEYDYSGYNIFYGNYGPDFLFPVKKFVGYTGSKVGSFNPTDPEERPMTFSVEIGAGNYAELRADVVYYLETEGIISKDYAEINSIYQSFPYDDGVYVFIENFNKDGTKIHNKKGMHRAKYLKKINPLDKYYKYANSQFVHTLGYSSYYGYTYGSLLYYKPHGFSIEMWPSVSDSDYELVPSAGLSQYNGLNSLAPMNPVPSYGVAIDWNGDGTGYEYTLEGVGFNGEIPKLPDGTGGYPATPPEYLKTNAFFNRSSPAFNDRNCKFTMLRTDYSYGGYETYRYEYNGQSYISYLEKPNKGPYYSLVNETIDSMEASYKEDTGYKAYYSITRSKDKGNPIDFNSYVRAATFSYLTWIGYEID